ncbi:MAG: hypothetical protein OXE81_11595 [Gammaproteobacteria bacterium]|nr:hypothetical protein [Gammaproteobacteria bacterium]
MFPITHIAPARSEVAAKAADALCNASLWDTLCETCLWQLPTFEGEPVHDADSALAAMLDYLTEPMHRPRELREAFIHAIGEDTVRALLMQFGRSALSHSSWRAWKRFFDIPFEPEDDDLGQFADGWALPVGHDRPYQQGDIPAIEPDENLTWGCDPQGKIFPIPI